MEWREVGVLVVVASTGASIVVVSVGVLVARGVLGILLDPTKEDEPELKKFTLSKGEKFVDWSIANTDKNF